MSKQKKQDTQKQQGPSESQLKKAFQMWLGGGVSLWDIKKKLGIKAKIMLPYFQKSASPADRKLLKSPGARKPVAKEEKTRRAA